jgi:DNA modification methylase
MTKRARTPRTKKAEQQIVGPMASSLNTKTVSTDRLVPYPGNPRRGNLGAIKESLERNGQYRPIVVRLKTNEVLAGNHTLEAARGLGWISISVSYVDCDEETARRIVLVDNRTNDLATYDEAALAELLAELPSLDGTGYDRAALDELLDSLSPAPLLEDEVPPLPAEPQTKPGDLYQLGEHRLLCGDARDPASYEHLLGGESARLLWTDPPYGVDYVGKTKRRLRIENDGRGGLPSLLESSFAAADGALAPGAPIYVCAPGGALLATFLESFGIAGWELRQTLVWIKDSMVLGRSDYHYRHEQLLYGFKSGKGRLGRGGPGWHGGDAETTVFEVDRPKASRDHPTMKPPELIERCLRNSSGRHEIVLDPFCGSGSTIVACERTGRRGFGIELDPRYCDVVIDRFEALTATKARRITRG